MKTLITSAAVCAAMYVTAQAQEITVAAMQPVVVKTVPVSGDTNVDPKLNKIQVTFSKDMTDGNWSWTQISNESFPEMVGKPRYLADKRTCELKVKLKPKTTYVIWLNSQKYQNFKDKKRNPAVPYLLVFETR